MLAGSGDPTSPTKGDRGGTGSGSIHASDGSEVGVGASASLALTVSSLSLKPTRASQDIAGHTSSIRSQLGWTLGGSIVLFVCIMAMGAVWIYFNIMLESTMESTSSEFRKKQAEALSLELAALLKPLYVLGRRSAYLAKYHRFGDETLNDVLINPSFYTSVENLDRVEPILFQSVARDTHARSVSVDGSSRVLNNFIGSVVAIALDESRQLATSMDSCRDVLVTAVFLDGPDPTSDTYRVGYQGMDPVSGDLFRQIRALETDNCTVGPVLSTKPLNTCQGGGMGALWGGDAFRPPGDFDNFTWFGPMPSTIGWGNHFLGSVPLYDGAMNEVGRLSHFISLGKSVGPLLKNTIAQGGDLTRGAHGAVYTAGGLVLGLSESEASPEDSIQAERVEDVVVGSATGAALKLVKERFGSYCPDSQQFISVDEVLVDVTPFSTEGYGMAPLGERWCQLMTMPRENVFKEIDQAASFGVAISVVAVLGCVMALWMLGRSLFLTYAANVQMNAMQKQFWKERVLRSIRQLDQILVPMWIMTGDNFLALQELRQHEDFRDEGMLKALDTVRDVTSFKAAGNALAFISHQWLGFGRPDDEHGTQLAAMQTSIRKIAEMAAEKAVHVWLDYFSVPQRHQSQLHFAISSLPAYVSLADYFLICAPDATHQGTGLLCNLESYSRRGWCRTEVMANACSNGLDGMFICQGSGEDIRAYTKDDFAKVSLKVFQGDFSNPADMEYLVEPILGLYWNVLSNRDKPDMAAIYAEIQKNKNSFFPATFAGENNMQAFGPLVEVIEEHASSFTF